MTPSCHIRRLAENDLEQIWLYSFHEWGLEQADSYIRLMKGRFSWLAKNPLLGKRRDDIKPGYYSFPEGRHVIFYIITESGIDIIGIPHQCMDIISHLE
jgi:toxin ParE1/3/4